jgi:hypothetical protein
MRLTSLKQATSFGLLAILVSSAACVSHSSDNAPPLPPAAGGTGAFGIVTVNGTQKLYLPLGGSHRAANGNALLAVVDVGVAGNGTAGAGALVADVDLGVPENATTTGGDATVVIAASTENPHVWFIDPKTDAVTKRIDLDASFGRSSFSGGGGYVTGIAMDSANHRAILSTWNGFTIVDTTTQAVTSTIQVAPSENFGFDSIHQRIIAPFYECSSSHSGAGQSLPFCGDYKTPDGKPITHGLNIIDLTDNAVYTYQDATADDPTQPVGDEPDSAAADPTSQVIVIPSEGGGFQNVIDLSQAHFDKASKSVTAPNHRIQNQSLEGVAVEPSSHFAFWEAEHASDVGVVDLNAANRGAGNFVHASMPNVPDGGGWSNLGDPHGIAVTTGIADGKAMGFVVSSDYTWVARVDLAKVASLGGADAGGASVDISSAVTYLDARVARGGNVDGGTTH